MAREEVGEKETARLGLPQGPEIGRSGKHLVAVGAADSLDALLVQHPVEAASRAAIAVEHEHVVVALAARADLLPHGFGDPLGGVVQVRRQALDMEVVPAVLPDQPNLGPAPRS